MNTNEEIETRDRRGFLLSAGGMILGASGKAAVAHPRRRRSAVKPPYRVLFSNDVFNTLSCISPHNPRSNRGRAHDAEIPNGWYEEGSAGLTDAMIRATVDEAEGVDAHLLQPGLGWIPWWKSKVYPADAHYRRWMRQTGLELDGFAKYMVAGGDVVPVFVERCRQKGQSPFVSLRLNDAHLLDNVGNKRRLSVWASRFYEEHPEYRLGPSLRVWNDRVLNWAIPEVREHKFSFIRELCENYDLDGFELDFMRHAKYFRLNETTSAQRVAIMTDLVARTRALLDRTARRGRRRWLCARVPCLLAGHDWMGIHLPSMVEAGLDMVNLSADYITVQQTDMARVRKLVPTAAVYLEMANCTGRGPSAAGAAPIDDFNFWRTTDQQFYTGAHLAYQRGADGISLWNFVYYREYGPTFRGPFNEPPDFATLNWPLLII